MEAGNCLLIGVRGKDLTYGIHIHHIHSKGTNLSKCLEKLHFSPLDRKQGREKKTQALFYIARDLGVAE